MNKGKYFTTTNILLIRLNRTVSGRHDGAIWEEIKIKLIVRYLGGLANW